jgi:hypothetical protein
VDAEPGLLGMVARSGSIWVEGVGARFGVVVPRTSDRDGRAEAVASDFVLINGFIIRVSGVRVPYLL